MTKPVPPTLRHGQRYLVFEVVRDEAAPFDDVHGAIWHACLDLLGEAGTAALDLWIVKDLWNEKAQMGAVKVVPEKADTMRAVLACITRVGGKDAIVHVKGVAGTMKSARKRFAVAAD